MKEKELAKSLVDDANNIFKNGITEYPQIVIDAIEYQKYNFDILKQELNALEFKIDKLENAPAPKNKMPLKNKLFIYKK